MKTYALSLLLLTATLLPHGATTAGAAQKRLKPREAGASLLLEVKAEASGVAGSAERTAEVIRGRCRRLRIRCLLRPRAGGRENRLALSFSGPMEAERVKRILLAKGVELRPVVSPLNPDPMAEYLTRAEAEAAAGAERDVFPLGAPDHETYIVTERAPVVTGDDVRGAFALRAPSHDSDGYEVDCQLKPAGAARLKRWTAANINRYIAVVYNGRALSAPYIRSPIWYNFVVAGNFTRQQASDVAAALGAGNLPAPVEVLEEEAHVDRRPEPSAPRR